MNEQEGGQAKRSVDGKVESGANQVERQTERNTDRQTDRKIDRQTKKRQTDRQRIDRQIDRWTKKDTDKRGEMTYRRQTIKLTVFRTLGAQTDRAN